VRVKPQRSTSVLPCGVPPSFSMTSCDSVAKACLLMGYSRQQFYESVAEMQTDLYAYLARYNTKRQHQGRLMNGRTPYQAFTNGLPNPGKPQSKEVEKLQQTA
jgi:hypothetical protein